MVQAQTSDYGFIGVLRGRVQEWRPAAVDKERLHHLSGGGRRPVVIGAASASPPSHALPWQILQTQHERIATP